MIIKKNRGIEEYKLLYVLIILFCMNFFGRGSVICMIFAFLSMLRMPRKIVVDAEMLYTIILCVSSFVASFFYIGLIEAIKCLNFFFMYFVGLNGFYASNSKIKHMKKIMFAVYFGFFLMVGLSIFSSNVNPEYTSRKYLLATNFWTGGRIASTIVGLASSVVIGYSFYSIFCQEKKYMKLMGLLSLGVILYMSIKTATRTPILLFAIVWFVMLSLYIAEKRGRGAKTLLALLAILFLVLLFLLLPDVFGVKKYVMSLPIYDRFLREGLETSRWRIASEHFTYMFDFMWGGSLINDATGHSAHNYIQQGHDLYGIFATVSLCLLELSFIKNIIKLISRKTKRDLDYLLISVYLSMLIAAHLEPIFISYPCFFFSLLLIHGMTNGYRRTRAELLFE